MSQPPRVSFVIPCYNHGKYIGETLDSIEAIEDKSLFEVVIVNDGSTDAYTNEYLTSLKNENRPNYTVIFQENTGVSGARNTALKAARGEYILPVDSDNRITTDYVYKALDIMDKDATISIVYSDCLILGTDEGVRVQGPYNLQRLMLGNFIDNCAVFRRRILDDIGYLDTRKSVNAIEDWEFWLRASFNGYKFKYINEPLFEYRVLDNSGSARLNADKQKGNENVEYFKEKHKDYFGPQYVDDYFVKKFKASPIGFIGKLILKIYFPKRFERLVKKGRLRRYI